MAQLTLFNTYLQAAHHGSGKSQNETTMGECMSKEYELVEDVELTERSSHELVFVLEDLAAARKRSEVLKNVDMLKRLSEDQLVKLAQLMEVKRYGTNEVIFTEGDYGSIFYILKTGEVQMSDYDSDCDELPCPGKTYKPGSYFGHQSLMQNLPHDQTATAVGPVEVLTLNGTDFEKYFTIRRRPDRRRVHSLVSQAANWESGESVPVNPEVVEFIQEAIRNNGFLENISTSMCETMIPYLREIEVSTGDVIIQKDQVGDGFYIVVEGNFDVLVANGPMGYESVISTKTRGDIFGEISVLYSNSLTNANIVASTSSKVWALSKRSWHEWKIIEYDRTVTVRRELLERIDLLKALTKQEKISLAEILEEKSFLEGETVTQQGETSSSLYILSEGYAEKIQDGVSVNTLQPGDYFGELGLLSDEQQASSIVVKAPTTCLVISRTTFEKVLGSLKSIMDGEGCRFPAASKALAHSRSSTIGDSSSLQTSIDDFDILGSIGAGFMSTTFMVKHRRTSRIFAMKKYSKQRLVDYGEVQSVFNAKMTLSRIRNPFIVICKGSFKDRDYLYVLEEPCTGGNFGIRMYKERTFLEDEARFYAACVVIMIEELQKHGITHRDIRPANLLIDSSGYLRLADFTLATKKTFRSFTQCGQAPEYSSPEQLLSTGYDRGVDIWALGILIYEMLSGHTPFLGATPSDTCKNVINGNLKFPRYFSKNLIHLLNGLLTYDPSSRLGNGYTGITEIKNHAWFENVVWDEYLLKAVQAPWVPELKDEADLRYCKTHRAEEIPEPFVSDEGLFEGF